MTQSASIAELYIQFMQNLSNASGIMNLFYEQSIKIAQENAVLKEEIESLKKQLEDKNK